MNVNIPVRKSWHRHVQGWYHSTGGWKNHPEEINFFRSKWTKLDEMPQGAKSSFMCHISMVPIPVLSGRNLTKLEEMLFRPVFSSVPEESYFFQKKTNPPLKIIVLKAR